VLYCQRVYCFARVVAARPFLVGPALLDQNICWCSLWELSTRNVFLLFSCRTPEPQFCCAPRYLAVSSLQLTPGYGLQTRKNGPVHDFTCRVFWLENNRRSVTKTSLEIFFLRLRQTGFFLFHLLFFCSNPSPIAPFHFFFLLLRLLLPRVLLLLLLLLLLPGSAHVLCIFTQGGDLQLQSSISQLTVFVFCGCSRMELCCTLCLLWGCWFR